MIRIFKSGATLAVMGLPLWFVVYGLLAQPAAQLKVNLMEPDVELLVDDCTVPTAMGQAGPIHLEPGDHTLRIMRGARLLFSQSVHLRPGERETINARWPLQAATARSEHSEARRFEGHTANVTCLAILPDGRRMISGSDDRTVRVWDVATGREILRFEGHVLHVRALAVSPDGRYVVSGGGEPTSILWELETGRELQRIEQAGALSAVAFSQQNQLALYSARDDNIRLFTLSAGALDEVGQIDAGKELVSTLAFSPDGACLAAGYLSDADRVNPVRIWDTRTLRPVTIFEGHEEPVWTVSFAPDGERLVSGSTDCTLRLWECSTSKELHRLEGSDGTILSAVFSPDGQRIVAGIGPAWSDGWIPARGYGVRVWDATSGKLVARFDHDAPVRRVAVSPDGRWVAAGEGNVIELRDLGTSTTAPTVVGGPQPELVDRPIETTRSVPHTILGP